MKYELSIEDLVEQLAPILARRLLEQPRYYGSAKRIHIEGETCSLCNTLFNTISGEIWIGENTFFGHDVSLLTGTHYVAKTGLERLRNYPTEGYDIRIGRGVWIASNATVLGPCTIGDNAVVAAGSVVTNDIPAGQIFSGVPARFKGTIL